MHVAVLGHTYIVAANRGKLRRLQRRGHRVLLLSPRLWNETDFGLRRFETENELAVDLFDCLRHGRVRRFAYPHAPLRRALRAWRPDVLLAETEPGGLAALQAFELAVALGIPLVPFAWENLPLAGLSRCAALPVYAGARRLLVGSRGAGNVARRAGCRAPITVIPQVGVDPDLVPSRLSPFDERPLRAMFIGRLDRKKGADVLLAALPAAAEWRAVIVGEGAERGALEAQTAALGLHDRVEFVGAIPHEQVPRLLAEADALVCPSRSTPGWTEQFGHVLAWAMAAGAPIVASRCGAIPEVVDDCGLLIGENDVAGLSAALSRLTAGEARRKLADAGRARARDLFTDEAVARRLEQSLVLALERGDADLGL